MGESAAHECRSARVPSIDRQSSTTAELTLGPMVFPILALYHLMAARRWGTSIGKSLFELEVVAIDTAMRPPWSAAIRRSLILFGLPIFGSLLSAIALIGAPGIDDVADIVTLASFPILVVLLLHASLRTPGKRTPWDRGSGTMVRYRGRQR